MAANVFRLVKIGERVRFMVNLFFLGLLYHLFKFI